LGSLISIELELNPPDRRAAYRRRLPARVGRQNQAGLMKTGPNSLIFSLRVSIQSVALTLPAAAPARAASRKEENTILTRPHNSYAPLEVWLSVFATFVCFCSKFFRAQRHVLASIGSIDGARIDLAECCQPNLSPTQDTSPE
jgi:hypothetical protein